MIDNVTNIIATIVDNSLYVFLLLGLTVGLFSVSAGLFLYINNTPIVPRTNFIQIGILIKVHKYGIPINRMVELI